MVFTAPPSVNLPTTEYTVGLTRSCRKTPLSLLKNDPFNRPPPYPTVWSAQQDTTITLPVHHSKKEFLTALREAPVVIFCAATATGKSTQPPQIILDDELSTGAPCRIICAGPRRLAARSLATQVGRERGQPLERGRKSYIRPKARC